MLMMIYYYFYYSSTINLREVGVPSRNILHVRCRGSKSRFRVTEVVRGAGAQNVLKKIKDSICTANFALLRDPLFLAPGMSVTSSSLKIE